MHDVDENSSFIVKMIYMIYIGLPQYTELFQKTRTVKTVLLATQILTTKEGNQINNVSPYNELYAVSLALEIARLDWSINE